MTRLISSGRGWFALGAGLVAGLLAGCAGGHNSMVAELHAPRMPVFLAGPMAVLLTNTDGFSARVVMNPESSSKWSTPVTGELLGRGGKLLFVPDETKPDKKHPTGSFSFILDVATGNGYLLNEALQGYAPISADVWVTNVATVPGLGSSTMEKAGGHPCEHEQVAVTAGNGVETRYVVWRAADLNGLAVRINPVESSLYPSLNLTGIRTDAPAHRLFLPPDGFTRYETVAVMMNELLAREENLKQSPEYPDGHVPTLQDRESYRDPGSH